MEVMHVGSDVVWELGLRAPMFIGPCVYEELKSKAGSGIDVT